jgi:putative FmdB family regulatory protein
MPIYAYRCESCGFGKDALQKMSDAPLTICPECGKDTFRKQVTAAGFQLKGSGWYVTDFRGGNSAKSAAAPDGANGANGEAAAPAKTEGGSAEAGSSSGAAEGSTSTAATPAAPAAAPSSTSGSGSGSA